MLGFDALGRLALGQVSDTLTTVLIAGAAAFTLTGNAGTFRILQASDVGTFTLTGNAATFTVSMSAAATSYVISGNPAWFVTTERKPLYISGSSYWRGIR